MTQPIIGLSVRGGAFWQNLWNKAKSFGSKAVNFFGNIIDKNKGLAKDILVEHVRNNAGNYVNAVREGGLKSGIANVWHNLPGLLAEVGKKATISMPTGGGLSKSLMKEPEEQQSHMMQSLAIKSLPCFQEYNPHINYFGERFLTPNDAHRGQAIEQMVRLRELGRINAYIQMKRTNTFNEIASLFDFIEHLVAEVMNILNETDIHNKVQNSKQSYEDVKGGFFLPALLPLLGSILGPIAGKIVDKITGKGPFIGSGPFVGSGPFMGSGPFLSSGSRGTFGHHRDMLDQSAYGHYYHSLGPHMQGVREHLQSGGPYKYEKFIPFFFPGMGKCLSGHPSYHTINQRVPPIAFIHRHRKNLEETTEQPRKRKK